MHLGILARTFPRPTLEETLDAIAERGLTHVQFNMSCVGLPTLPERLDENLCIWIARSFRERGLTMAAISGTFNLCDPDPLRLIENLRRLEVLAAACRWLDTRIITLCTGTRDPEDIWKWHPENIRRETWETLIQSMQKAVAIADRHEVTLAFEPERNNVVNSVPRARMLLDHVDSPWLKVVLDPANLMHPEGRFDWSEALDEAFDWLGADIVLAHAKNPSFEGYRGPPSTYEEFLVQWRSRMPYLPEQQARLIWGTLSEAPSGSARAEQEAQQQVVLQFFYGDYVRRLQGVNFEGALVLHGLPEERVDPMRRMIAAMIRQNRQI
jgi:sugar phosphate isomerase/epimerase